jgi:hypothetical protein
MAHSLALHRKMCIRSKAAYVQLSYNEKLHVALLQQQCVAKPSAGLTKALKPSLRLATTFDIRIHLSLLTRQKHYAAEKSIAQAFGM